MCLLNLAQAVKIMYKRQQCERTRKTKEQLNLVFKKYFRQSNLLFASVVFWFFF